VSYSSKIKISQVNFWPTGPYKTYFNRLLISGFFPSQRPCSHREAGQGQFSREKVVLCINFPHLNQSKNSSQSLRTLKKSTSRPLQSLKNQIKAPEQRGSSRSGSSKARANSPELDRLSSAQSFLSFEPVARLSSIISMV
jgi:hypothetical protein